MVNFGSRSIRVRTSKQFCTLHLPPLFPSIAALAIVAALLAHPRTSHADILYVSNYDNPITRGQTFTILRYDSVTGSNLGTFASTGLDHPTGLAFDSAGNLYVANSGNDTIEKFTASGGILSTTGSVFASTGVGSGAQGLAFDSAGNLYVANSANNTIGKHTSRAFTPCLYVD
jgi:sugar lactone lactonase YvrE